eukprot:g46175.t1
MEENEFHVQQLQPNIISVRLYKRKVGGLGFLVKQRVCNPPVIISDIIRGGTAEESGLVQVGDIIVAANGKPLVDVTYEYALEMLKNIPPETFVVLILRGPEGFSTHLETTFTGDGTPKTVRVTKPLVPVSKTSDSPIQGTQGKDNLKTEDKMLRNICNPALETWDSEISQESNPVIQVKGMMSLINENSLEGSDACFTDTDNSMNDGTTDNDELLKEIEPVLNLLKNNRKSVKCDAEVQVD